MLIMNIMADEWSYIMSFTENNNDKCNLLMVCKQMGNCNFYFYGLVCLTKINGSIWYDKFINVTINDLVTLPLHIKSLTFDKYFDKPINGYIPSSITHLTFGSCFNQPIEDCIPSSVTHLTFGWDFNQPINDCIPLGVTHLTFDYRFNQSIKNCIPLSVTHLTFSGNFNQPINNNIPSSVRYLEFKGIYKHSIGNLMIPNIMINGKNIKKK